MEPDPAPAPAGDQQNTLGLLSMILGILSIPLVFCFVLALPAGITAIVLGLLGLRRVQQERASNRGQAMAGIICGAIGTILMLVVIALPDS